MGTSQTKNSQAVAVHSAIVQEAKALQNQIQPFMDKKPPTQKPDSTLHGQKATLVFFM